MKHSLFKNQVIVFVGILLVSFIAMGIAFGVALQNHFYDKKADEMLVYSKTIANELNRQLYMKIYYGISNTTRLGVMLDIYKIHGYEPIIVGNNREVENVTSELNEIFVGQSIDVTDIESIYDGKFIIKTNTTFGGFFSEPMMTVGYPVQLETGEVVGAVFINAAMHDIKKTIYDVYKICLLCLLATVALGSVIMYFSVKRITKPLLELNNAAQIISDGDLEKRIVIKNKDEVGQLAESFNEMAESLYEQDKIRRNFISDISHDIRTPLTSIQGFLNAVLDGTIPEESKNHYLIVVLEETKRITRLANNIIDINKIENKSITVDMSVFELNDLIRHIMFQFEKRVEDKKINVNLVFDGETAHVKADKEKISRVIYNLVDNAIKFTPEESNITIETTQRLQKIFVKVKDSGIGISEYEQKHIFDRFFKADESRGIDTTGSGLGLSIVKNFIRIHNETIEVESVQGEGTAFIFTLTLEDNIDG